jgi:molybdenum-dependent DNA-binding transcriptional regulator ModE
MEYDKVKRAIEAGGSIRAASQILGVSYQSLQWWIARKGLVVIKTAHLVEARFEITEHGREAVAAMVEGEAGQEQEKE